MSRIEELINALSTRPAAPPKVKRPRKCVNWSETAHLKIAKMLAWCILRYEGRIGAQRLISRVDRLFPTIVREVLSETRFRDSDGRTMPLTLDAVLIDAEGRQRVTINAEKLYQRANKTERYKEFNEYKAAVECLYLELASPPPRTHPCA